MTVPYVRRILAWSSRCALQRMAVHRLPSLLLLLASTAAGGIFVLRRRYTTNVKRAVLRALKQIASSEPWRTRRPGPACVILSGGLDSSISAEIGTPILGLSHAITVIATDSAMDLPYATASAAAAGLQHHVVRTTLEHLLQQELPHVVEVMQSFDPMSLRNEIAISCALRKAFELGCTAAVTGDAADELFGGYSFTHGLPNDRWKYSQKRMAQLMQFGSVPLGGGPDGNAIGKIPLRRAFPHVTSAKRGKDPIEVGCGTTQLSDPAYFSNMISDDEFATDKANILSQDSVVIRDKEHLFYYRVFKQQFPGGIVPGKERGGPYACPACRYPLRHPTQTFCHTCGHYDPNMSAALRKNSDTGV